METPSSAAAAAKIGSSKSSSLVKHSRTTAVTGNNSQQISANNADDHDAAFTPVGSKNKRVKICTQEEEEDQDKNATAKVALTTHHNSIPSSTKKEQQNDVVKTAAPTTSSCSDGGCATAAVTPAQSSLPSSSSSSPDKNANNSTVSADLAALENSFSSTPLDSGASDQNNNKRKKERTPLTCPQAIQELMWNEARYDCSSSCQNDNHHHDQQTTKTTKKRSDYLSWEDYFMATAALAAQRSKDPIHATGACLVDTNNRIIGTGYSGFPSHCSDDVLPWNSQADDDTTTTTTTTTTSNKLPFLHTKDAYVVHAEVNVVLNKVTTDCTGATLYTLNFPCQECSKIIIQSGIAEVVYVAEQPPPAKNNNSTSTTVCNNNNDDDDKEVEEENRRASRIMLTLAGVRMRAYQPTHKELTLDFDKALHGDERPKNGIEESAMEDDDSGKIIDSGSNVAIRPEDRDVLIREANYDPTKAVTQKRRDYLSWDDYFLSMAFLTAQRSKDPNTQVGACIVDGNQRIVGLGYNGFPTSCSDDVLPWARQGSGRLHTKYMYVVHAEANALLNKGSADVRGATLYVALFPCNECAKLIIQAGIKTVVYMSDRYHDTDSCRASRILLEMARVTLRKHIPKVPSLQVVLDRR